MVILNQDPLNPVDLKADTAIRRRSVALGSDPAMKEMVHFVGSHEHDSRLKDKHFFSNKRRCGT